GLAAVVREGLVRGGAWAPVVMRVEWFAVALAAGPAPGAVRLVAETPIVINGDVVDLRAGQPRRLHPIADRDRLAGRNADDCLGKEAIKPRVPLAVAA